MKFLPEWRVTIDQWLARQAQDTQDAHRIIEIGMPDEGSTAEKLWPNAAVDVLDMVPYIGVTHVGDLTKAETLPQGYDIALCTEVLEHTTDPWAAVRGLDRLLKPGGLALVSTPCNMAEHRPEPDCWRFLRAGLAVLFKDWYVEIMGAQTPDRAGFPVGFVVRARKHA